MIHEYHLISHINAWINKPESAARVRINAFVACNYADSKDGIDELNNDELDTKYKFLQQLKHYLLLCQNIDEQRFLLLQLIDNIGLQLLKMQLINKIEFIVANFEFSIFKLTDPRWLHISLANIQNNQKKSIEAKRKQILMLFCLVLLVQVRYQINNAYIELHEAQNLMNRLEIELNKFSSMYQSEPERILAANEFKEFCVLAWNLNRPEILGTLAEHGLYLPDDQYFLSLLYPPFSYEKPELSPELKNIIVALTSSVIMLPLPPSAAAIATHTLSDALQATQPVEINATEQSISENETIEAPKFTGKTPKARSVKPAAPPPPPPSPLTPEQQERLDFTAAIQQLKPDVFNAIVAKNSNILENAADILARKLAEKTKKKDDLSKFFQALNISLRYCASIYQNDHINKAESSVATIAKKILIEKILNYPQVDFFADSDLIDPSLKNIKPDLKNINDPKLKQRFEKKISDNAKWLNEQKQQYQAATVNAPDELATIKAAYPVSATSVFKETMQSQKFTDNPLWQKISSFDATQPLTADIKQLITALQSETAAYELDIPITPYAETIFGFAEKTGSVELLEVLITSFRPAFDKLVEQNVLIVHHWLEHSKDNFFEVLLNALTPEQKVGRVSYPERGNYTPLYKALHKHKNFGMHRKINLLIQHGANEEPFINATNQEGNSTLSVCLAHGFDDICLKFLEYPSITAANANIDGQTALHYWAAGYSNNIDIFDKLYALLDADTNIKGKTNNQGATFLHALLKNTTAAEISSILIFEKIFAPLEAAFNDNTSLDKPTLEYLKKLLLTEDKDGHSLYTLAETRDWYSHTHAIANYIFILFKFMGKQHKTIENNDYKQLAAILDRVSKDSILFTKFEAEQYDEIIKYIDLRLSLRYEIQELSEALGYEQWPTSPEFHPFISHIIDGRSLFTHIFRYEHDSNDKIEKLRTSTTIRSLAPFIAINTLEQWLEIIKEVRRQPTLTVDLKLKVEKFAAMLQKYGFSSSRANPIAGTTIADDLAVMNNPDFTTLVCDNMDIVITPSSLFSCCASSNYNHDNVNYLMVKYSQERAKHDFAELYRLNTTAKWDLLDTAVFKGKNLQRIAQLIDFAEKQRKMYACASQIIPRMLVNIGRLISWEDAYEVIRILLSKPFFKDQLTYSDDGKYVICLNQVFVQEVKNAGQQEALHKIIILLLDHGSDLFKLDKSNQNIFHYAAAAGASLATINLLIQQVQSRCPEGTLKLLLSQKSIEQLIPAQLILSGDNDPKSRSNATRALLDPNTLEDSATPEKLPMRYVTRLVL